MSRSRLEQSTTVACPLAQAGTRLGEFFRAHAGPTGDTVTLSLGVHVPVPGGGTPLALEHGIVAKIRTHRLPADMTPRYDVRWSSATPGPFPTFEGELVVEGNDDYDTFSLHLKGSYEPPLGLVGRGFDAAVGNRVAQATGSDLLARIKDAIERDFRAHEDAKGSADKER